MDVRVVESLPSTGALNDTGLRIDPAVENISLVYDDTDDSLAVVDYNLNYGGAIFANGGIYKKVFLTYNGCNCDTNQVLETVVLESANTADALQRPGYNNSNEWEFFPKEWKVPNTLLEMTDPNDYSTYPYDVSQGFTVVKQFLTGEGNISPGDPAYTAFYRAPHLISFQLANAECNRVYTDGWYTSYVIVVPEYETYVDSYEAGQILYSTTDALYYVNLTGTVLAVDPMDPEAHLPANDTVNWRVGPTFIEWQTFMRNHVGSGLPNEKIYFAETQHLVTAELNAAIRKELQHACGCCKENKFGVSQIDMYMRLMQKRLGAFVKFNDELFHEAQCIIESSRKICYMCLFHGEENCKTC